RDVDALYADGVIYGLQRHNHLDGRTVRVGNDAGRPVIRDFLRVNLGNNQRDVGLETELGGVVDDDAAGRGCLRRELGRNRPPGGEQADLDLRKIEVGQVRDT